ncbi:MULTISPECIES: DUF6702 family protein [Flavobacterium]|uniref:DUF6702 family protein n=1 Tax=Flavobacterium TaxID=237 RepID=UPI0022AC6B61|nr:MULTISPECIES: DUF6702 family protein [Flavobacterium]
MKKRIAISLVLLTFFMSSFGVHKFYMAIYQINYVPEKKMLQITSRIFIDDLNKALEKKYNKKVCIGNDKETVESIDLLKKYFSEKLTIKVNGLSKPIHFLSKEMDGDVLVCYLNCKDLSKINSVEIFNSLLLDCFSEQQNIMHINAYGKKNSFLFTETSTKQVLKY